MAGIAPVEFASNIFGHEIRTCTNCLVIYYALIVQDNPIWAFKTVVANAAPEKG